MTDTRDREVLAVLDGLYQAWTDNDAEAFVAGYTQDATSILPGSYCVGPAATRDRMAAAFAGPLKGSRVRDEVQSVRHLGADAAIVVTRSAVMMAGEAEAPDGRWVMATWTLARRDGRWLLAAYHNCPA
ncbi:SgcJ/EcaC family oxidoreductase [Actinocorallia longicatena]|uniref:SgcJ/EcaC family oxidoreductase n=1 Tax=Actinocorallia longicatena TaxID=111803 RepID=A0ABP6QLS1_9ACTN